MLKVYDLAVDLAHDPEQVTLTQALTLNPDKPSLGLRGNLGLFGSREWWENVHNGIMPTSRVTGVIQRVYISGQDESNVPNAFDLLTTDGSKHSESMYANLPQNYSKFVTGATVEILYAYDELKQPAQDGQRKFSPIVVEMAVST